MLTSSVACWHNFLSRAHALSSTLLFFYVSFHLFPPTFTLLFIFIFLTPPLLQQNMVIMLLFLSCNTFICLIFIFSIFLSSTFLTQLVSIEVNWLNLVKILPLLMFPILLNSLTSLGWLKWGENKVAKLWGKGMGILLFPWSIDNFSLWHGIYVW